MPHRALRLLLALLFIVLLAPFYAALRWLPLALGVVGQLVLCWFAVEDVRYAKWRSLVVLVVLYGGVAVLFAVRGTTSGHRWLAAVYGVIVALLLTTGALASRSSPLPGHPGRP